MIYLNRYTLITISINPWIIVTKNEDITYPGAAFHKWPSIKPKLVIFAFFFINSCIIKTSQKGGGFNHSFFKIVIFAGVATCSMPNII